jgi:ankyrin repeat protein
LSNDEERSKKKERMNGTYIELIDAVLENNVPEFRRLLSDGADVNAKHSRTGLTSLSVACHEGHVQLVKELVEHGADVEAKDNGGNTPLHYAAITGSLTVVNEFLSPNDSNGATTTLLGKRKSRGANIEATNNRGNTPLHCAISRGSLPVVKALLSGGANILAVNNESLLPTQLAVTERHSAVAKCLLQHFYATIIRRLPLHVLLEDLTWISHPGFILLDVPPLCLALHLTVLDTDDAVEIVEYLVGQNSALLSSRDQDGSLPLHVACRRGASFNIVQSLVNHYKASVKSRTPQGDLPLFLACEIPEPSLDTIFILIKLYPDVVYR